MYYSERDDFYVLVPQLLDLTLFFTQMQYERVMYELIALVNHFGSLVGGHYTAHG
jgi:ubiquitin C-terminal hydrolase